MMNIGLKKIFIITLTIWTLAVFTSCIWNVLQNTQNHKSHIIGQAEMSFAKDVAYRTWVSNQGGVYVPVSELTPSNPYLDHPRKNILTVDSHALTLVNPAYMTRQVFEENHRRTGSLARITSLKPINPMNTPLEWERVALTSFEKDTSAFIDFVEENGEKVLHYMKPFVTEESCLKCHAIHGYKVGDIRGGIGLTIPLGEDSRISATSSMLLIFGHLVLWLFGVAGIVFSRYKITQYLNEKKQAQKALVQERNVLNSTLSHMQEGVIALDLNEKILWSNVSAQNLLNHSNSTLVGKNLSKVYKPESDIFEFILLKNSLGEDVEVQEERSEMILQNGEKGILLVLRDITKERRARNELEKAIRLESLGTLAGGLAHDFNNLLTAILGNITVAQMMSAENAQIQPILANSEKACIRASHLTKQLLTFSKGGSPIIEFSNLSNCVKESAEFVLSGSSFKCVFKDFELGIFAYIDVGQISQVVHNLVLNASQASKEGGNIEIGLANITSAQAIEKNFKNRVYAHLQVKDFGSGISSENLEKLFDPYFTTKEEGNGLGLSSTFSIIKKHNGYIKVESEIGKGTCFHVFLPASKSLIEGVPLKQEKSTSSNRLLSGKRILLMDDDQSVAMVLESMLIQWQCKFIWCKSEFEVLEMYQKSKKTNETIDLYILDLTIVGGSGAEQVIKKLLELNPDIKALVCSGYAEDELMLQFDKYGFKGALAKPFSMKELESSLTQILS